MERVNQCSGWLGFRKVAVVGWLLASLSYFILLPVAQAVLTFIIGEKKAAGIIMSVFTLGHVNDVFVSSRGNGFLPKLETYVDILTDPIIFAIGVAVVHFLVHWSFIRRHHGAIIALSVVSCLWFLALCSWTWLLTGNIERYGLPFLFGLATGIIWQSPRHEQLAAA
jgi:hypothetical protein